MARDVRDRTAYCISIQAKIQGDCHWFSPMRVDLAWRCLDVLWLAMETEVESTVSERCVDGPLDQDPIMGFTG